MIKAKRDDILNPLSAVSGIIERRHTLPILSNVLIEQTGSNLSFLATDIEIQITARTPLQATGDTKAITVGARKLVDILRALPEAPISACSLRTSGCRSGLGRAALPCRP